MFTADQQNTAQVLLERAVAVSLRPSQYVGWEIGTAAHDRGDSVSGSKQKLALVWLMPYGMAMADAALGELYDVLKGSARYSPERIFLRGEDLQEELRHENFGAAHFSLENKLPAEDFDVYVIRLPLTENDRAMFAGVAAAKNKTVIWMDPERDTVRSVLGGLGIASDQQVAGTSVIPLIAYSTAESKKLRDTILRRGENPSYQSRATGSYPCSYRVCLARKGWARFISHLEQIQLLKNSLMLSGLPIFWSSSGQLRPRVSFGPAVSVGWCSESEFFDVELSQYLPVAALAQALMPSLPAGYQLVEIQKIPRHFPSLEESVNWVEFNLEGPSDFNWQRLVDFSQAVTERRAPETPIRKEKKDNKVDIIDLREVVAECSLLGGSSDRVKVFLALRLGPKKHLKPEKIIEVFLGIPSRLIAKEVRITRTALALEFKGGHRRYLCQK